MSCSNPFICGIRKYDQHKVSTHTPNNMALHRENESRLEQLLQLRQQQDQGLYSIPPLLPVSSTSDSTPSLVLPSQPSTTSTITYYSLSG